jgi:hypothetical protein
MEGTARIWFTLNQFRIRVIGANSISVLARISDVTRTSLDFREVPADIRPIMSTFETLRPARYTALPEELG